MPAKTAGDRLTSLSWNYSREGDAMRVCGHDEVGSHSLLGFQTALAAGGEVQLTLRYGAAMAPSEISLQMNARQAGRLAQGLLLAMSVGDGRSA